jgi:hypothetical protein
MACFSEVLSPSRRSKACGTKAIGHRHHVRPYIKRLYTSHFWNLVRRISCVYSTVLTLTQRLRHSVEGWPFTTKIGPKSAIGLSYLQYLTSLHISIKLYDIHVTAQYPRRRADENLQNLATEYMTFW